MPNTKNTLNNNNLVSIFGNLLSPLFLQAHSHLNFANGILAILCTVSIFYSFYLGCRCRFYGSKALATTKWFHDCIGITSQPDEILSLNGHDFYWRKITIRRCPFVLINLMTLSKLYYIISVSKKCCPPSKQIFSKPVCEYLRYTKLGIEFHAYLPFIAANRAV